MERDVSVSDSGRMDFVVERDVVDVQRLCTRRDIDLEYRLAKEISSTVFNFIKKHGAVNSEKVRAILDLMLDF